MIRSGVFGYDDSDGSMQQQHLVELEDWEAEEGALARGPRRRQKEAEVKSSMVADEYEYQTQRQRDIRSRLEKKEMQKKARRGGPLVGRLASHQVFRRLE